MAIRWVRTSRAVNAKIPQAMGWAKEAAAFVEKKTSVDIRVSMAVTGRTGVIRWEIDFPDMKTFEEKQGAVLTDQDYWKMIGKAMDDQLFVDGTTSDEIFQEL